MEIIGYICAILVGVSLGILGSGGSILTVPIMVYLLNVNPVDATGYSLFVVGITSAIGCATYIRRKLVDLKTAAIFAAPSIICVFLTRKYIMPAIPNPVFVSSSWVLSKELLIMILFALLMIAVAFKMIRKANYPEHTEKEIGSVNYMWLIMIGAASSSVSVGLS